MDIVRSTWILSAFACATVVGGCVGLCAGLPNYIPDPISPRRTSTEAPLPHQVPKYPGGVSLRLAMVHDVLHERYPRHGKAYYAERNRRVRIDLTKAKPKGDEKPSAEYFSLLDDLGAGLDHVGEHEEAIRVLREKLQMQEKLGMQGRDLYSSYANLGTFLILGTFRKPSNDPESKARLAEGLKLVKRSIEVKPDAHFGREVWQAVVIEFVMAVLDNPTLLTKYDMVGNSLEEEISGNRRMSTLRLRPFWDKRHRLDVERLSKAGRDERDASRWREDITKITPAKEWLEVTRGGLPQPFELAKYAVPFDEPVLGIIGMWRLGVGPNSHFALALGELMARVGQLTLAWCAFERAAILADRFWPDKPIQRQLVEHCRRRQKRLEGNILRAEREKLRERFRGELAYGVNYQKSYQDYEVEQIRKGASIDDPSFYDAFFAKHGRIATRVGDADSVRIDTHHFERVSLASILLFAGIFAFVAAVVLWWMYRPGKAEGPVS